MTKYPTPPRGGGTPPAGAGDQPAAGRPSPPARTWSRVAEAWQVIAYRPHLRRTALTALVVGTVLFLINHLDAVVTGTATTAT